jgi:large subunit ribosomal protein L17
MNKRNKVKSLNRSNKHRNAMLNNMVTSLFMHERIESTSAKLKVARTFAEKLITRAKKNLAPDAKPESKLHNRREVMKTITNTMVVDKLFEDLAVRYQERKGGYTRILKLVNRPSDNSEMALLELVDKKEQVELKEAAIAKRNVGKTASKEGKAAKTPKAPKEPKVKAEKKTASKPKAKKVTK